MGPVYERLGLTVGFVQERMSVADRQHAYAADVTYLTAKEAGFDHLRDALALEPGDRAQREYHFALVDEADSILIDEARIPLVIAGETATPSPARRGWPPWSAPSPPAATTTPTSTRTTSPSPRRARRASRRPSAGPASTRSRTSPSMHSSATPSTPSTS